MRLILPKIFNLYVLKRIYLKTSRAFQNFTKKHNDENLYERNFNNKLRWFSLCNFFFCFVFVSHGKKKENFVQYWCIYLSRYTRRKEMISMMMRKIENTEFYDNPIISISLEKQKYKKKLRRCQAVPVTPFIIFNKWWYFIYVYLVADHRLIIKWNVFWLLFKRFSLFASFFLIFFLYKSFLGKLLEKSKLSRIIKYYRKWMEKHQWWDWWTIDSIEISFRYKHLIILFYLMIFIFVFIELILNNANKELKPTFCFHCSWIFAVVLCVRFT